MIDNTNKYLRKMILPTALITIFTLSGCGGDCLQLGGCGDGTKTSGSQPITGVVTVVPAGSYAVTYSVSGSATRGSLTYSNSQGGTSQETVDLPWQRTFVMKPEDFLYISAQNQDSIGNITSEIFVGSTKFKTTTSEGPFVIATASGTCC